MLLYIVVYTRTWNTYNSTEYILTTYNMNAGYSLSPNPYNKATTLLPLLYSLAMVIYLHMATPPPPPLTSTSLPTRAYSSHSSTPAVL